ncbi:MAG: hypothetical protein WA786_04965 [Acidimicrobiales bacterium]
MQTAKLRLWASVLTVLGAMGMTYLSSGALAASAASAPFHVSQILQGSSLHHAYTSSGSASSKTETLSDPDDISRWGNDFFVGFQNGVGPQGQASTDGNRDSTVVELTLSGHVVAQWDVLGKTDGLTSDPGLGVIATVNEDANSALYLIHPTAPATSAVTRYSYSEPLPHGGGTDAISIENGQLLVSASAPGTSGSPAPQPTYPAVYVVKLDSATKVATISPLFFDESSATVANVGTAKFRTTTKLALTDPDSSEAVPSPGPRFAGDFMLTSQGDEQQIYVSHAGTENQELSVLSLTQSVDDTAWPSDASGSLYTTDSTNDAVDVVTGPFVRNQPMVVATPCGANGSPATCPAPKFPANYLAALNPNTGTVTRVLITGSNYVPQGGLAFVAN